MAIIIQVGGVDRTTTVDGQKGVQWGDLVNGRGELSITFFDAVGGFRPQDGQELLVLEGGVRRFGGILTEPEEQATPGLDALFFDCTAVEFTSIADRRNVSPVIYEDQALETIVIDIATTSLDGEGLSTAGVETGGPVIVKAVFNDVPVSEAFNQLSELTGRAWWIDYDKVLHFRSRESIAAPAALSVDAGTVENGSVRVRPDRERYRNRQILRAGKELTLARTESLVGDGERRVFSTAFPIGAVPTVEVSRGGAAFSEETVGILGVEEGKQWFWNVGVPQVTHDDGEIVLAAPTDPTDTTTGDRVHVIYRGLVPLKVEYADETEIADRQAIEGGSGKYEHVVDRPELDTSAAAIESAISLIDRYGRIGKVVIAASIAPGFAAGQLVTVDIPEHNLHNEELLIESIAADISPRLEEIRYTIRAISGDAFGGWQQYFRRLKQVGRQLVIEREGEVLVLVRSQTETVICADSVSVDEAAPESRIGVMEIGRGELGAVA